MRSSLGPLLLLLAGTAAAQPPAPVEVWPVVEEEISLGQRVVGTVQPLRTSTIGSAQDGRVLKFDVNDGDRVRKGQTLAQLRPETFQIQLAAAEAELELFKQQLAELENGSLPETIAEAAANMRAAKASMDNAAIKLRRLVTLSESAAASKAELEDAQEQADATRFAFLASEALLKRIEDGPRIESIAQAQARVDLQTQQIRLLEDQIEKLTIVAPFDGWVAAEFTEVGAWISRGDPVAQVVHLDEVEVQVPVTAELAVHLHPDDAIRVEFPELPEKLFVGTVDRVVPVADSRARTFPVYIRMANDIENGRPTLMAGMLARVELPSGRRRAMPLVPKDALVLNGPDRSVFVVERDSKTSGGVQAGASGKARKVPVDLGVAVGGLIQVSGELKEDDLVVVVGNERLRPGAGVTIVGTATSPSLDASLEPKSPLE